MDDLVFDDCRERTLLPFQQDVLERACDALRRTTGLNVRVVGAEAGALGKRFTGLVEIDLGKQKHRYAALVKRIDRLAPLGVIKDQLGGQTLPGLLVAPRITAQIAEGCLEMEIPFIDVAGNAYLRAPGMIVFVKGQRLAAEDAPLAGEPTRAATAAALRVVFALLCRPELLNAPYREIAKVAGVALGTVGPVLMDLDNRGLAAGAEGKGRNRRILEPGRLLDEWVTNYPIRLRPRLNRRRFRAPDPQWWKTVDAARHGALWGGEVAADRLTGYLKPATCTLYLTRENARERLAQLILAHRLHADPTGEVEILDVFWNLPTDPDHPDLVPPILVYADLLATLDPRNLETARLIRRQHVENALRRL